MTHDSAGISTIVGNIIPHGCRDCTRLVQSVFGAALAAIVTVEQNINAAA